MNHPIYGKYFQLPTLHNLFCNRFFRPGRNKCRSHPSTGCTLHTSSRLHATPGRERLSVCTGHGSDFHILHTLRILASLQRAKTNTEMQPNNYTNICSISFYISVFCKVQSVVSAVLQRAPLLMHARDSCKTRNCFNSKSADKIRSQPKCAVSLL